MPMAERKASVVWNGGLSDGSGTLNLASGAAELPVSWPARVEESGGKTSPEELVAAAHATCYSMAFSNVLGQAGHPPEQLRVDAVCTLDKLDDGLKVTKIELTVHGKVPGLDQSGFDDLAKQAEQGCPISNLVRNGAEISLKTHLES